MYKIVMMIKMRIVYKLIVALFIISCATSIVGRDFNLVDVDKLEEGKTTTSEVMQIFGQPMSKTVTSEGIEVWIYIHSKASGSIYTEIKSKVKSMSITFKDGVVSSFTRSETFSEY